MQFLGEWSCLSRSPSRELFLIFCRVKFSVLQAIPASSGSLAMHGWRIVRKKSFIFHVWEKATTSNLSCDEMGCASLGGGTIRFTSAGYKVIGLERCLCTFSVKVEWVDYVVIKCRIGGNGTFFWAKFFSSHGAGLQVQLACAFSLIQAAYFNLCRGEQKQTRAGSVIGSLNGQNSKVSNTVLSRGVRSL